MRNWDTRSANGVDLFLTNSHFVSQRVDKYYRRRSIPLYPPVTLDDFRARGDKDNYYITVSRLVPYKRVDLIVEAFAQMPDRKLIVIGDGPEFERLKLKATPNIQMLGQQSFSRLRYHLENARAFVFAAEEDFGIAPVEAQACGTPVIAYGRGGALESVVEGKTGIFFEHQTPESLTEAVVRFEAIESWDTDEIRKNAERFSTARFRGEFFKIVEAEWTAFRAASEASKAITTAATNVDLPIPSKWLRLHRTGDIRSAPPVNVSEHRPEDPDWSSDSALEGVA
jgi:glycosyltransferase involved in cell wall biosynthesis